MHMLAPCPAPTTSRETKDCILSNALVNLCVVDSKWQDKADVLSSYFNMKWILQEAKGKTAGAPKKTGGFHIVGIGASAGGLEAFEKFFENMPRKPGMTFILVPHLDRTHVSLMPELLQKCSKMKVFQVTDGIEVKPNAVYIVPPNKNLAIINATLQLLDPAGGR